MKKLIYTAAAMLMTGSVVFAQSQVQAPKGFKEAPGTPLLSPVKKTNSLGKADMQEWYEPAEWLNSFTGGSGVQTYVQFLMPDSLAVIIDETDTTRNYYAIAAGQLLDPKDDIIDGSENTIIKMSQYSSYRLDSFYLNYIYVRNVDSFDNAITGLREKVVDTLIVSYLTNSNLTRYTVGTPPNTYAAAIPSGWDRNTLSLTSLAAQEKFALTDADSTFAVADQSGNPESSWRLKLMSKKVGPTINIPANNNNIIAIVYQFKLGMPHDTNSVMIYQKDPSTFPAGKTRTNYFGYRFASNSGSSQWRSSKFYNHALVSFKANAYYPSNTVEGTPGYNNGWAGFVAGNAFTASQTLIIGFNLDAKSVGVKENDLVTISSLYPNPANGSTNVNFDLKKSGNVKISIVNIVGQEVRGVDAGFLAAGNNTLALDLNSLNAGVYFVNINVDGVTSTKKLTVSK
jgi:hypothetical protein